VIDMADGEDLPQFLESAPPVWAARGLASILLCLAAVAVVAAVVVQVPETVSATFVLVPERGADPVRAFRSGMVAEVRVAEAQSVEAGDTLFTITSTSVGDRAADWETLQSQAGSAVERVASRRERDASQRLADADETRRLEGRIESLGRSLALKQGELKLAREMASRQKETFDQGLSSWMEMSRVQIEAEKLELEVEEAAAERKDTERSLEKVRHEAVARRAEAHEAERGLREELDRTRIRKSILDQDAVHGGNQLAAVTPCAGVVVKLAVRSRGAIVQEGDLIAEVVCQGERLQAELAIPQGGMALLRPGQRVKLLYDAFPYQRYGARAATLRWISPAKVGDGFRAFADLERDNVVVQGERRPLAPGMGGTARVVVGRRALVSYAFEPLRQLRESMTASP
jgi:membrane fusion protein